MVTFLSTDIEESTRLWERDPAAMRAAHLRYEDILQGAIEANGGYAYRAIGSAAQVAFPTAVQAIQAAIDAQLLLFTEQWAPSISDLQVAMALHTGHVEAGASGYSGPTLTKTTGLLSAGHGGQVLLSNATQELVRDHLSQLQPTGPPGVQLLDLGEHRLKDLARAEHIFQLLVPGLPARFPPLRTLNSLPNNLPRQATPLVGREKQIAEVVTLLRRSDVSLVTLTGPAGTGKTRLSLQVGAQMLKDYEDGVWFVELATISPEDHRLVPSTIAETLGVREAPGQAVIDTLKDYLRDKQMLLVVDNFEQVIPAAPQVSSLLKAAPQLKVLVSSRIALRLYGEREYHVPPLSLPDRKLLQEHKASNHAGLSSSEKVVLRSAHRTGETAQQAKAHLEQYTQCEAVRLFVDRCQAIKADFQITPDNAPDIARICARLDGLPLAIELAAARIRLFTPQALLGRLSERLKILTGGAKDLPARQQTLRGAIEWSYDLLSEEEKQLFRRLSVFNGGRTLEAIETVCNVDGSLQIDVLEGVQSLLDKSLLVEREGHNREPRYWMLETIQEYAWDQLRKTGEREAAALRREHALYFMALAEEAEAHLTGKEQHEWLDRLEDEQDNIRTALAWAHELAQVSGQVGGEIGGVQLGSDAATEEALEAGKVGLRIVGAIWRFWQVRGLYAEGRELLQRAISPWEAAGQRAFLGTLSTSIKLTLEGLGDIRRSKARALHGEGTLAYRQGDYSSARSLQEAALELAREVGDKQTAANSLSILANVADDQGDYPAARALHEESLALKREIGDKRGIATTLSNLGNVAYEQGDYPAARAMYEESLSLRREIGDKWGMEASLGNLGNMAADQGEYAAARAIYEESLALGRELGDKRGIATTLSNLGIVAYEQGDYPAARALHEESLALKREIGDKRGIATILGNLGIEAADHGDYAAAHALYEECLAIQRELGDKRGVADCLAGLGGVVVRRAAMSATRGQEEHVGQVERGTKLLGAAEGLLQAIGAVLDPETHRSCERSAEQARGLVGEKIFNVAWDEGRAMSMDEAAEYALQSVADEPARAQSVQSDLFHEDQVERQRQVEEQLHINIDQDRKARQVEAITGTQYFIELQARASALLLERKEREASGHKRQ
jgi:predicted ATPase/class 3 adenylate cyclase/Tfp pilus assembly protein PilF